MIVAENEFSKYNPPCPPSVFPDMVLDVIVAELESLKYNPPPYVVALCANMVLDVIVAELELVKYNPPPLPPTGPFK